MSEMQNDIRIRPRVDRAMVGALSNLCIVLGVATLCALSLLSEGPLLVRRPAIPVLASCLLLVPPFRPPLATLQKVVGAYLCCTVIDAGMAASCSITLSGHQVHVPAALLALVLFMAGRLALACGQPGADTRDTCPGWSIALAVLACHTIVACLLQSFGYSVWRDDLSALGWASLCYLVCWSTWPVMDVPGWRRALAALLILYYGIGGLRGDGA